MEIVVGGFGAVVFCVAPVEVMVVNESAIENYAAAGLQGACENVCGVGLGAPVERRAQTVFGIGFDDQAAEVGNSGVNLFDFVAPPCGDTRVGGIEGVEAGAGFRAG